MTGLRRFGEERSGLRLFRLLGIEIRLDYSVLIIFTLIVYSLGAGLFPQWHPQWSALTSWSTALAAGIMFFVSLLAHELSHSLMARRYGIRVPRITLFLFGGMAEIETEARTPREEFAIAVVGPLMSAALAFAFGGLATLLMDTATLERLGSDPQAAVTEASPLVTACLWLGSVNLMLALFNLVPGFPLDGGRVLRALIWWLTGDAVRATRVAAAAGRGVGWMLMGLGFWNLLALRDLGGLWLVLIGWFLTHLARAGYSQMVTERSLRSVRVADVMRTRFETVPPQLPVPVFLEEYLLRSSQQLWPVVEGERCIGTLTFADVSRADAAQRGDLRVADLLTPLDDTACLHPDEMATAALRRLAGGGDQPVPVVAAGRVVGLVRSADILRWAVLHPPQSAA